MSQNHLATFNLFRKNYTNLNTFSSLEKNYTSLNKYLYGVIHIQDIYLQTI